MSRILKDASSSCAPHGTYRTHKTHWTWDIIDSSRQRARLARLAKATAKRAGGGAPLSVAPAFAEASAPACRLPAACLPVGRVGRVGRGRQNDDS